MKEVKKIKSYRYIKLNLDTRCEISSNLLLALEKLHLPSFSGFSRALILIVKRECVEVPVPHT